MNNQEGALLSLNTLRFPFLGTRRGGEPFEYLLMNIDSEKAHIAIFKWMVNYTTLEKNEKIDLYLPIKLTLGYDFREDVLGGVTSINEDEETGEYLYEISLDYSSIKNTFDKNTFAYFPYNIPVEIDLIELLSRLIKDSIILKEGLIVYLKHFSSYFSRIVDYPIEDYADFKKFVFGDLISRIQTNIGLLGELSQLINRDLKEIDDISIYLNLEELRETIESEINLDLFLIAFTPKRTGRDLVDVLQRPDEFKVNFRDDYYMTYLFAIKNLEKRLYFNYNQIVLIYMKSVSF